MELYLPDIVGRGYREFWNFRGRYRVVKGSRASKKSKTTALWYIVNLMKNPSANLLVVRKTERSLRDSCYSDLIWAMERLGVRNLFSCTVAPLQITYKPTGQQILFRGVMESLRITSISTTVGSLCWLWVEEAYEISDEAEFQMLDESIRGESDVPKQITLTFNPWSDRHWLKARFFDKEDPDVLAMTVDYRCNEWLDAADLRMFEQMKKYAPRRYRVAGLGEWGVSDGLVYNDWEEATFDIEPLREKTQAVFGLDFGYTTDPAAMVCALVEKESRTIWVFDELYARGLTNRVLYQRIEKMGYQKERIVADSAEPKSIDELRAWGLSKIEPARKGADSVRAGIKLLQDHRFVIHPRCQNFLREISQYAYEPDGRVSGEDHLMDAMRYARGKVQSGSLFSFE